MTAIVCKILFCFLYLYLQLQIFKTIIFWLKSTFLSTKNNLDLIWKFFNIKFLKFRISVKSLKKQLSN